MSFDFNWNFKRPKALAKDLKDIKDQLGFAFFLSDEQRHALDRAATYLERLDSHVCKEGFVCPGGPDCDSDHR